MALTNETASKKSSTSNEHEIPFLPKLTASVLWFLFFCSTGLLVYYQIEKPNWNFEDIFYVNGFTLLIWTTVTFFSSVVSTYAKSYLKGFKYHNKFAKLSFSFTLSVMAFVMSNHIVPFLVSWLMMSILMSLLIGINSDWSEARAASKLARKYFVSGSALLSIGILILSLFSKQFTINGILNQLETIPEAVVLIAAVCIITSAIIQSAMYPFHRWLLSAMTAPTPASALMHAGFVNGAGILLTILSGVLISSNTLTLVYIVGGLTAVFAQFTKLLQVNVKQKLACSTIAQMGFMIMQCGLGFFNAAVVHLILHGFYKAYLFLSSGEEIEYAVPKKHKKIKIKPFQAIVVLILGIAGAVLFSLMTGKTQVNDSSVFLTLVVGITVGQITFNIVKEKSLTTVQKAVLPIALFVSGIVVYALLYNGVTILISEMPLTVVPQPLSVLQIVFGVVFLLGFFIMKLGLYKKIPWLYVKLMNLSQPNKKTILN